MILNLSRDPYEEGDGDGEVQARPLDEIRDTWPDFFLSAELSAYDYIVLIVVIIEPAYPYLWPIFFPRDDNGVLRRIGFGEL